MLQNLAKAFGTVPAPIPATAPVYTVKELSELSGERKKPIYRKLARKRVRVNAPQLQGIQVDGRWAVILSREDIQTGFLNSLSGTVNGYTRQTSFELARNIVLNRK